MATGASRVRAQRVASNALTIPVEAAVVVVLAGVAEMGPIGSANDDNYTPIQSVADYRALYGGHTANAQDLPLAVEGIFAEVGESSGLQLYVSRVVHCTTPGTPSTRTSAKGNVSLLSNAFAPTYGKVVSSQPGPYDLDPDTYLGAFSKTLKVKVNGGGAVTVTFTATAAARESAAGTFNVADGDTFTLALQGGAVFTKTFHTADNEFPSYAAVTPAQLAASLNAFFIANQLGALATVTSGGTKVTVTSLWRGSASGVNVGGTAALGFTTGNVAGGGNVPNVHGVTPADAKVVIEGAVAGTLVSDAPGALQVATTTGGGGGSVQIDASAPLYALFYLDTVVHQGLAGAAEEVVLVEALWDGTYAGRLTVLTSPATGGDANRRDVALLRDGSPTGEKWVDVTVDPADDNYLITLVNEGGGGQRKSRLVRFTRTGTLAPPLNLPALGESSPLVGGLDGLAGLTDADFIGATSVDSATGLRVFDVLPRRDEVAIPGRTTAAAMNGVITYVDVYCEGNAFGTLGSPLGYTVAQMRNHVANVAAIKGLSERARVAYPRVQVNNPDTTVYGPRATVIAPQEGVLIGVHARVSAEKVGGAFTQPAGSANGYMRSVRGLETLEAENIAKRGLLQGDQINVLRAPRGSVRYIDGTATLKKNGIFASVGASRGVILVSNDLIEAYEILRQQNITDGLLSALSSSARVYLRKLTAAGAFRTKVDKEAFFVDTGPGVNTADTAEQEEAIVVIGLNTATPANQIVVSIARFRGLQAQFEAVA